MISARGRLSGRSAEAAELQETTGSAWTGRLRFTAFDDAWFLPPADVVIDVGPDTVEIRADDRTQGRVARDELRVWFAHGTADLPAGPSTWRARASGVALALPGSPPRTVPDRVTASLASHL